VLQARATDIPAEVQAAVSARANASHKLQQPIIDAGSAMQGVYIYLLFLNRNERLGLLRLILKFFYFRPKSTYFVSLDVRRCHVGEYVDSVDIRSTGPGQLNRA
jgi:hypothetical protein